MEINDDDQLTELAFSVEESARNLTKKLANEKERLQRPESAESYNDDNQLKLHQAMLRRQELLDRIRQEQVLDDQRPRTYSPRRRYTPSPLPPPSRRSLPDLNRAYHFNWYNKNQPKAEMSHTKHIIEHQFRQADPVMHEQKTYVLPPIHNPAPQVTTIQAPQPIIQQLQPQVTTIQAPQPIIQQLQPQVTQLQAPQPIIQQLPAVQYVDGGGGGKSKDTMFNKSDFMDMMMLQNAQMHHMVMQQMMLQNLPGAGGGGGGGFKNNNQMCMEPMRMAPVMPYQPPPQAPVVHHYQSAPPGDGRQYGGRGYYGDYGSQYGGYY